ncbi:MAG: hypothetical protein ACI9V1_000077 [Spirosomataceae bacterium]|jgi:hypothetical protein
MTYNYRDAWLCCVFLLFFLSGKGQSPWVQKVNDGFIQAGYSGLYFDQVRYKGNLVDAGRKTIDNTYQLYLDFGLLPNLGVTAILPVKNYTITENGETSRFDGLGNLSFSLKYQLPTKSSSMAVGLTYEAETRAENLDLGLRTGFAASTFYPYFSIGSGTKKLYFYASGGLGLRTNKHSNFVRLSGELGYKIFKYSYLIGTLDFNRPIQNDSNFFLTDDEVFSKSASFLDRQSFNGAGLKFLYEFVPEKYGVTISTIGALGSNNTPFSRSYNLGIFRKF